MWETDVRRYGVCRAVDSWYRLTVDHRTVGCCQLVTSHSRPLDGWLLSAGIVSQSITGRLAVVSWYRLTVDHRMVGCCQLVLSHSRSQDGWLLSAGIVSQSTTGWLAVVSWYCLTVDHRMVGPTHFDSWYRLLVDHRTVGFWQLVLSPSRPQDGWPHSLWCTALCITYSLASQWHTG